MEGVLRRVGAVHAYDPGFHVLWGVDGCPCMYKNYYSFQKHLHTKHFSHVRVNGDCTSTEGLVSIYLK